MKRLKGAGRFMILMALVLALTSLTGCATRDDQGADLVFYNGTVYTQDGAERAAQAVAIRGDRIIRVGSDDEILALAGRNTRQVDLQGGMVLPSFVDAHMHPAMSAVVYLYEVSLHQVFDKESYLTLIREFVEAHPEMEAVQGGGFMRSAFDEVGPRKEWLDEIDSERPIAIVSVDGHSLWVNSKALEMAGITADTPDPHNGVIKKDPVTGEPSGLLQEDGAMGLVREFLPGYTKNEYKEALLWLQEWFNAEGITTAYDAAVPLDDPEYYQAYQELAEEGLLTIRYRGGWLLDPKMEDLEGAIDAGLELSEQFTTPYWQVGSFKFFSDQVIEEETGFLLEPYSHRDDDWYGIKVWDDEVMADLFTRVDREGFQIHVHQIGDAAARYTLDALEKAVARNGERDSRHSFAHVQLIEPEDVVRMGQLGMSAHTAPYWIVADDYYYDLYAPYLGEDRVSRMYPLKSLFEAGVNATIHSDFFVTEPNYAWAFYSAVTRALPQSIFELWYGTDSGLERTTDPGRPLNPEEYTIGVLPPAEERISLEKAIKAATWNGAWANFLEDEIGSIEEGKLADLVVYPVDLFDLDPEEYDEYAHPVMTLFEGRVVFEAP
jgi:hypothetical protein